MDSKKTLLMLIVILGFALSFFISQPTAVADDEPMATEFNSTYESEPDENIGAWYDEAWEATGFYSTADAEHSSSGGEESDETWQLRYQYTTTPEGESISKDEVCLPADSVVVEWKSSGHVHFASGL